MCVDLDASGDGAPVPYPQNSTRAIQDTSWSNPGISSDLDRPQNEHVVVHRGALAEAIRCGVIVALGEKVSDRDSSVKLFFFANCKNSQKLSDERDPSIGSAIGHSGI